MARHRTTKFTVEQIGSTTVLHLDLDPLKVKRGHQPYRSGAGCHADRRYRRRRTRRAVVAAAINE